MKRWGCWLLAALWLLTVLPVAAHAAGAAGTATLMVYLCGSDLERWDGAASLDIEEMRAGVGAGVNVVIETGGSLEWQNPALAGGKNQRHLLDETGLHTLETSEARDMTDPDTLSDFIQFCAREYPADRYFLVLWDHGGGPLYGFGSDENFPYEVKTYDDLDMLLYGMSLAELDAALTAGQVHFDWIGFDACLMGSVETALAMSPYADYFIASEELEPTSGWSYTGWLRALVEEPDMDTEELGIRIVDEYLDSIIGEGEEGTLSLIDLDALSQIAPTAIAQFAEQAEALLDEGAYAQVSKARDDAKAFGYNEQDLVDFIDLVERSGADADGDIVRALRSTVVYHRDTGNIRDASGLSVYFPYHDLYIFADMLDVYEAIDWDEDYVALLESFAELRQAGQADEPSSPFTGNVEGALSEDAITLTELDGEYVLSLTDEQWTLVSNLQMNVFLDDGEGYVDLGLDDAIFYTDEGDAIAEFDFTWVALDGQIVPFYSGTYSEGEDWFRYTGYVPIVLNGEDAELVLAWDSTHEDGYVVGARLAFSPESAVSRGVFDLLDGDLIQPYCQYYLYDGTLEGEYFWGDDLYVDGPISVSYESMEDCEVLASLLVTDVYGNEYWTESIAYGG